jgi:hypothetical protein
MLSRMLSQQQQRLGLALGCRRQPVRKVLPTLAAQRQEALPLLEMVVSLLLALERLGCRMADRCRRRCVSGFLVAVALAGRLSPAVMSSVACLV